MRDKFPLNPLVEALVQLVEIEQVIDEAEEQFCLVVYHDQRLVTLFFLLGEMQKVGHPHCTLKYYREGCSHFMRHVLCLHRLSLLKIDNSLIALRKQLVLPVHGAVFEADGDRWLIIVVALDEFDLEDLQFVFADETVALLFSFAIRLL